jgi:hypothetical protein
VCHVVSHLGKGQGHHDEIDATGAKRQHTHQQRIGRGGQHADGQQPEHGGGAALWRQQHRRVSTNAQKRRLPKADQAGATYEQLQAQCKDGKDHDLGDQVDAVFSGDQRKQRQCGKGQYGKNDLAVLHGNRVAPSRP